MNNIQKNFKTKSSLRDMEPPKKPLDQGGMVHGKGGPKDDLVGPIALSAGEYVLPADTVEIVGRENLEALRLATHDFSNDDKAPKGLRGMSQGGPATPKPKPKPAPVNMGNPLSPGGFNAVPPAPAPSLLDLGAPSIQRGGSMAPRVTPVTPPPVATPPPVVPDPRTPPNNTETMPQRSVVPPAVPAPGAPQTPGSLWDGLRPPSMPSSPLLGPGPGASQAPASPSSPTPGGGGGIPRVPGGPGAPADPYSLMRAEARERANLRLKEEEANLMAAKADEARAMAMKRSNQWAGSGGGAAGFKDGGSILRMKDGGGADDAAEQLRRMRAMQRSPQQLSPNRLELAANASAEIDKARKAAEYNANRRAQRALRDEMVIDTSGRGRPSPSQVAATKPVEMVIDTSGRGRPSPSQVRAAALATNVVDNVPPITSSAPTIDIPTATQPGGPLRGSAVPPEVKVDSPTPKPRMRPSGYGKPVTQAVDALAGRIKAPAATPPASMAGRAGNMLRGAATGVGRLATPLALLGSAAETYNTPTEQYAARFGVDPRAPEGIAPGTEFFRDHLLRTAGAASDLAVNAVDAVPGLWNMFAPENRQLPMLGNWVAEREAANGYVPPPPKVAAEEEWVDEPASAEEMARRQAVVDSFSEPEAATPSPLRGAGYAEIGGKRYVYNPDTQGFGVTAENLPLRTRAEHAKTASEIIPARPEPTAAASEPLSPTQEANARYDAMTRHIHGLGLRGDQYANAILNVEQQRNAALQNAAMLADRQAKAGAEYEGRLGGEFVKTIDRVAKSMAIGPEGKPDLDRQEQVRAILTNVLPPEDRDLLMRMDEPSREAALRNYLTFFEAQQIESGVDRGAQISNTLMGALPGAALLAGGIASRSPLAIKSGLATMVGGGGAMALNTPSRSNSMQHDEAATRFNPDTGREEQLPQSFSLERAMEVGPIDALTNWDNEVVSDNGRALRRLTGDAAKAKKQYDQLLNRLRGQ